MTTTTSNPVMKAAMQRSRYDDNPYQSYNADHNGLTPERVATTTLLCLGVVAAIAVGIIYYGVTVSPAIAGMAGMVGAGGLLVTSIISAVILRSKPVTPWLAIVMAILEGCMVGGLTFAIGSSTVGSTGVPGWVIVGQALIGTVVLFIAANVLWATGIFKVTGKFARILSMITIGFAGIYAVNFIATAFFGNNLLFAHGIIPIVIAAIAIVLASLSINRDFTATEEMVAAGADDSMRWSLAVAFMVDIVWLYTELLRLLYLVREQ